MISLIKSVFKRKSNKKVIIGLSIAEEEGFALLIEKDEVGFLDTKIRESLDFKYTDAWERLVEDVDEVLFRIEKAFNVHVKDCLFFVYSHLTELKGDFTIKANYLEVIKKVVKENDLSTLGYIPYHEVIAASLQKREQNSFTGILLELDKPALSAFIYKAGQLIFSKSIANTQDIKSDLTALFDNIPKNTILPARILIYYSSQVDNLISDFVNYKWSEKLFVQIPKVEILSQENIHDALLNNFSDQTLQESSRLKQTIDAKEETPEIEGFFIGKDIKEESVSVEPSSFSPSISQKQYEKDNNMTEIKDQKSKFNMPSLNLTLPKIALSSTPLVVLYSFVGIAIISVAIFMLLFYIHKVEITLLYNSKSYSKELTSNAIPVKENTKKITAKKTINTTGTQDIGDKAKGSVVVHNASTSELSLEKNTVLLGSANMKFVLDSDISIASASTQITSEGNMLTITGKTKTNVTAGNIGKEYNISKDTKLRVEDRPDSDVYVIADSVFTGGSKKNVQTVSKTDIENLKKQIKKEMEEKEKDIIQKDKDTTIINSLTELTFVKESYSGEVAQQANELTADIEGDLYYYTYSKDDVKKDLINQLKKSLQKNYTLTQKDISYSIIDVEKEDNSAIFTVKVRYTPRFIIDKKTFLVAVKGQPISNLKRIIEGDFKLAGYKLLFKPEIPVFSSYIPFFTNNIFIIEEAM